MKRFIFFISLILLSTLNLISEEFLVDENIDSTKNKIKIIEIPDSTFQRLSKNSIFFVSSYLLLIGQVSVYYDRILNEKFSVRIGASAGATMGFGYIGPEISGNYISKGSHKLEMGIGIGFYSVFSNGGPYFNLMPVYTIGYRYQPKEYGLFFKAGIGSMFMVPGLSIGLGAAF